jgi:hypothetical protein
MLAVLPMFSAFLLRNQDGDSITSETSAIQPISIGTTTHKQDP